MQLWYIKVHSTQPLTPHTFSQRTKKNLHFLHRVKIKSTFKKVIFTENVKNWYGGSNFNLLK